MPDATTMPVIATPVVSELESIKQLIAVATALNQAEKQYWLDLLPTMNAAQLDQLKNILVNEQKTITQIDQKYDQKLENVAQKYLSRWDSEKVREVRLKRAKEEETHQTEAHGEAEALLKNW